MLEIDSKGKCKVVTSIFYNTTTTVTLVGVLEVVDAAAGTIPALALHLLHLVTEGQDLHTVVVERIRLGQVDDVELDSLSFSCVSDSEKVPLNKTLSIVVIFTVHFIFVWTNFHYLSKVTTFKS